mgnify:CR=1 FL=1
MKIEDFIRLWEQDGFKFVKLKEVEKRDLLWMLFSVNCPYSAEEYGRHLGMLLVVDKTTKEILAHDMTNESYWLDPDQPAPPSQYIYDWFERHVREGLPDEFRR